MTTAAGYFDRRPSSSIRPGLSHLQPNPSSPHTPQRTVSSAFSSPSLSYRAEEETLIFEFGARHFSAGFSGESYPRCRLSFGLEESRRVGDYTRWLPGYEDRSRSKTRTSTWGQDHELWRMDLRGYDLNMVEDKIERAVRTAYSKYLLLDAKSRRITIVLPSVIPLQLLSITLSTLFSNFQMPSITLLSSPLTNAVAAGCRSGLIIDIGWRETIITSIYEYRELYRSVSTRAMQMVTLGMAQVLEMYDRKARASVSASSTLAKAEEIDATINVDLEQAEEATIRMAWCRVYRKPGPETAFPQGGPAQPEESISEDGSDGIPLTTGETDDISVSIPSPSSPHKSIEIPFSSFAEPVEIFLLAKDQRKYDLDDHDQPLHLLLYKSLMSLPPDVRAVCMSRIIFSGGGSQIPGLKARLLDELCAIVQQRGWNPVEGKAPDKHRQRLKEISNNQQLKMPASPRVQKTMESTESNAADPSLPLPASVRPQERDDIGDQISRNRAKDMKPSVTGTIRCVETLGSWAGASLVSKLKIKGIVEIERDIFLQHGLAGARRGAEVSAQSQRGFGAGAARAGVGEKTLWTLGAWA